MKRPVATDPVKQTLEIPGAETRGAPASLPVPACTTRQPQVLPGARIRSCAVGGRTGRSPASAVSFLLSSPSNFMAFRVVIKRPCCTTRHITPNVLCYETAPSSPVITFRTPLGTPASALMAASSRHVTDAISDGCKRGILPCKMLCAKRSLLHIPCAFWFFLLRRAL